VCLSEAQVLTRSDFIKELLDLPSTTPSDIDSIQLNQTADIVRYFIHCASSAGSEQYAVGLDIDRYKEYFELCDFLQAPEVHQSVLKSIANALGRPDYRGTPNAWDLFTFAARRDDFALAKLAISGFDRSNIDMQYKISEEPPSYYDDLPTRYVLALFRSFVTIYGHWRKEIDAAAHFNLT
jgi:hypothetical protein